MRCVDTYARREKGEKPLALWDKGTLEAEQRGWGEGGFGNALHGHHMRRVIVPASP